MAASIWQTLSKHMRESFCLQLVNRNVGKYVKDELVVDQLALDFVKGTVELKNLHLDVEELNQSVEKFNWPFEIIEGYVETLLVRLPWFSLLNESSTVHVTNMKLVMEPKQRRESETSTFESMWNSMSTSSIVMEFPDPEMDDNPPGYPGMNKFAQLIESLLSNVQMTFTNTTIEVQYLPMEGIRGVGIIFDIDLITLVDESVGEQTKEEGAETPKARRKKSFLENSSYKAIAIRFQGVTMSTLEFTEEPTVHSEEAAAAAEAGYESFFTTENSTAQPVNERHVILFGKFTDTLEVVVRMKRTEDLKGPKVGVEISMRSLLLYLSPRQIHLLTELVDNLLHPDEKDTSKYSGGTPMTQQDYDVVEQNVYLQGIALQQSRGLQGGVWSGSPAPEAEPTMYSAFENDFESTLNASTSMESSLSSSYTSTCTEKTSRTHKRMNKVEVDPTAEIVRYDIHLASLSLIILHEDYLTLSLDSKCRLLPSTVEQLQTSARLFFQKVKPITAYFQAANAILDRACGLSHLRLLATDVHLEGDETSTSTKSSMKGYLDVNKLALSEVLYDSNTNSLEHVKLLAFGSSKSKGRNASSDCVINFKYIQKNNRIGVSSSKTAPKTEIVVRLSETCTVELDISIIDRISALLNPIPICVNDKPTVDPWTGFQLPPKSAESKIDLKVSSTQVTMKLMFPKPDFRPPHDQSRIPWWKRNVHEDYLSLVFRYLDFHTILGSDEFFLESDIIHFNYHSNESSTPVPLAQAGFAERYSTLVTSVRCRLNIKFVSPSLDGSSRPPTDPMMTSGGIFFNNVLSRKGPFETKMSMGQVFKEGQDDPSVEILLPGEKHEINVFIRDAIASSKVQIDVYFPTFSVQIHSKRMLETIYNLINNCLLLWEPSAPKPKTNKYASPIRLDTNLDVEGQDHFSFAQSTVCNDSESSSEEDATGHIYYSAYEARPPCTTLPHTVIDPEVGAESNLSLNINIAQAKFHFWTPVRGTAAGHVIPGQHGEIIISLESANLFIVNGYKKDDDLGFVCLEIHKAELHHCDMRSTPSQSPPLRNVSTAPGNHMRPTIYRSSPGMLVNARNCGANREMVTLCIKVQANHETHHVKNVTIAAGLNKATLLHHTCPEPNSWISQLIDFFTIQDCTIPGYNPKQIMTEIQLHFWDMAVDYRPIHLPFKVAITLSGFRISSHLTAEVNTGSFTCVADDACLLLCEATPNSQLAPHVVPIIDLRRHYICLIELGCFEISLKTSDKKNTDVPHSEMKITCDNFEIRTCTDSGLALARLIKYVASNGDLPQEAAASTSAFSSPRHKPEEKLVVIDSQETSSVTESQHRQIMEHIQDALADEHLGTVPQKSKRAFTPFKDTKVYRFPGEDQAPESSYPVSQYVTELGTVLKSAVHDSDDEFCFIDVESGSDIFPKGNTPEIVWLHDGPIRVVENMYPVPLERADPLRAPRGFPKPVKRYTVQDMNIRWIMMAGNDFELPEQERKKKKTMSFRQTEEDAVNCYNRNDTSIPRRRRRETRAWLYRGGVNRDSYSFMQLNLRKIRFRHEEYPEGGRKASRQVLIITDFEILDRHKESSLNKFLSLLVTPKNPRQTHGQMLTLKTVFIRPDLPLKRQEGFMKLAMLPLRLHIDQDALMFLINCISDFGKLGDEDDIADSGLKHAQPDPKLPVMTVAGGKGKELRSERPKISGSDDLLLLLGENRKTVEEPKVDTSTSTTSSEEESEPMYFRSVIFVNDLHMQVDYTGKHLDIGGAWSSVIMGLVQLNGAELVLKRFTYKHGLLGVGKVLTYAAQFWFNDIKKNQLPEILKGVGPVNTFVMLLQGVKDLFWLPVEQYKKDGRILRGLHRGANSFSTSTAMAALELTTRFINLIQVTAETAFDMLTPGPSVRVLPKTKSRRRRYGQPKDIREGVANAVMLIKEGFEETADNIVQVAAHEHEQKGYSGAIGGVMRQVPSTFLKPVIIASEATNNVLGGVRSQLVPGARKEAHDKWRIDDTIDNL